MMGTAIILAAKAAWGIAKPIGMACWGWVVKPPGLYVAVALGLCLAVWQYGGHEYRAGQAACETAHTAAAQAAIIKQDRRNTAAVAASEARTTADTKVEIRNHEVIRYVTRQAATLPGGNDICIPTDIADRVRDIE